ncbi:MAG: UDP-3-O-(3-hydroxymyristoyl)glucosamine N-acyltransferase [Rikenellaceae bacterium]
MQFSAEMIAAFLEGEVVGDKDVTVSSVAKIEEGQQGALSFLSNPKYEPFIYNCCSSIVIVGKSFEPKEAVAATMIKVDDPYASFAKLLELYNASKPQKEGVSSLSFVDKSAMLGEDCYIGEFVSIGVGVKIGSSAKIYPNVTIGDRVKIGDNCLIYPGVVIYEDIVIGDNVTIHSGSVIGADGFGFAPQADGSYKKIPQIGNVIIEDWVEIGANSCVDRATMGSTIVKRGTKLDNLIQLAHNTVVGENCVFASQVGVAGSTHIGDSCMFGGQVGVAGHIHIANRTVITSQSGISNAIKEEGRVLMGSPAYDASDARRTIVVQKNLPNLSRKVAALEKELCQIKELINAK